MDSGADCQNVVLGKVYSPIFFFIRDLGDVFEVEEGLLLFFVAFPTSINAPATAALNWKRGILMFFLIYIISMH